MVERTVVVENELGLHARPAALFVQMANTYDCDIHITCEDREVDAKSILKVLSLGVTQGMEVNLTASGPQEKEAIAGLVKLLEDSFPEGTS